MPCNDGGGPYHDDSALRLKIDDLTRMLCGVCSRINKLDMDTPNDPVLYADKLIGEDSALENWWVDHQIADQRRIAKEKEFIRKRDLRKNALAKLTDEEKKELGLGNR